jgi:hypothetical protein
VVPKAVVLRLVELASQAPSVHNTQPWIWRASDDQVSLYPDYSRQLPAEDPSGRNLVISCGAALDHFRYAAHALGWDSTTIRLPGGSDDRGAPLAVVQITRGRPSNTPAVDLDVLRTRCTDRRRFTSWPVPTPVVEGLVDTARSRGTHAAAVVDDGARVRLELLANLAHERHLVDAVASDEQQRWVGDRRDDGVPLSVLPVYDDNDPMRSRFGSGMVEQTRTAVESGDGVIVLGGDGDDPGSWLLTGEALSALWLDATRAGLSVVPLSLPVEIDSVRDDLRKMVLNGGLHPHLMLRIGWQAIGRSQLPRTPRRPVSDVLRP